MVMYDVVDELFPTDIAFTSVGGSSFSTAVVQTGGGEEQRIGQWDEDLAKFDIAYGILELDKIKRVKVFADARRGMLQGFLFKFHEDFECREQEIGIGDGALTEFQLVKDYFDGPDEWLPNEPYVIGDKVRPTTYAGQTYVCIEDGTSDNAEPTWDDTIGAITTDGTTKWSTLKGPEVYRKTIEKPIYGTVKISVDNVLGVEGVNYTVNYSTGMITLDPAPGNGISVLASFDFYKKVRFENDHMPIQQDLHNGGSIRSIPLVELRADEVIA